MKKILGYAMIAAAIGFLIAPMIIQSGIVDVLIAFAVVIGLVVLFIGGLELIKDDKYEEE